MSAPHVRPDDLTAWVGGTASGITAMSVEQHVVGCPYCQRAVAVATNHMPYAAQLTPDAAGLTLVDLESVWSNLRDEIEVPRASAFERLLVRLGLPSGDAMLVAAAPALRGSWLCAVALSLAFAVGGALASRNGGAGMFLMFAPLVPVVGVAVAFGPEAGPALEQESSAPYPLVRLVFLRAAAVLLAGLPVVVVGQLAFPDSVSWLWLVPALGFTALVLGLSTWFGPWRPAIAITFVWIACTGVASRLGEVAEVLSPPLLVLYLLMLIVGPAVLVLRARHLGTIGRISS
ncbi:MAG TPA: hypothetical protein VJN29_02225 [Intrasporangium sp.]|uniref:hypothetical protein n=1 Tax=Intrasporangium sp. TaxID=1925024 RepID=UPI002B49863E|nr:hypothetical protein [Intrasporangium sp.]HKX66014.1 hypothetical protein [Intrasporangium sp.]